VENADSIKIEQFNSIKDFPLSSEQQSTVQRREANNKPNNYYHLLSFYVNKGNKVRTKIVNNNYFVFSYFSL